MEPAICKLPYSCLTSFKFNGLLKASLKTTFSSSYKLIYSLQDYSFSPYFFSSFFFPLFSLQKNLKNLTVLNFDKCEFLRQIPDVSNLPNLEELSFEYCENLITFHNSIGVLNKLQILSAEGCWKLRLDLS